MEQARTDMVVLLNSDGAPMGQTEKSTVPGVLGADQFYPRT
ncbi:MAG: hypothetical protein ACRDPW_06430 [Mycobacteriales bacterium]